MSEFIWPVRVYYEDTDSGGVVYHSNYLNFMERARTEWLRHLQLEQDQLIRNYDLIFVVRSVNIDFLKPALFNEALQVLTTIKKLARASVVFEQKIIREVDQQILTRAEVKIASISMINKKPMAIPPNLHQLFKSQETV